jgi:glycosyltransferase involved in cell wall biosynthesis
VTAVEERGGAVKVLTTADPLAEPDARVERQPAIPFWAYPQLKVAAPWAGTARKAFASFNPNVVHAATPFGVGLAARMAARRMGLPLVTSYHTHFTAYLQFYKLQPLNGISWPFLRWFHNSGLATFAPSEHVRSELEQHGLRNTHLWTRGVDQARFHPRFRSSTVRASLGATGDQIVVLYVGRLAPEKGIDALLEGMSVAVARRLATSCSRPWRAAWR